MSRAEDDAIEAAIYGAGVTLTGNHTKSRAFHPADVEAIRDGLSRTMRLLDDNAKSPQLTGTNRAAIKRYGDEVRRVLIGIDTQPIAGLQIDQIRAAARTGHTLLEQVRDRLVKATPGQRRLMAEVGGGVLRLIDLLAQPPNMSTTMLGELKPSPRAPAAQST